MSKKIISIGYEIPGYSEDYTAFGSTKSLMEADILLISPDEITPRYDGWVSFSHGGGGCYDVETSRNHKQKVNRLKKDVTDHLNAGKTVVVLLTKEEEYLLAHSVSTEKKGSVSYSTESHRNYNFLPVDLGNLVSGSGTHIEFSGNALFSDLNKAISKYFEYQLYIENLESAEVIFRGKDKNKILGAFQQIGKGYLILLPYIKYDNSKFTTFKKDKDGEEQMHWTDKAVQFGNSLVNNLIRIDKNLQQTFEGTPPPSWVEDKIYISKQESKFTAQISKKSQKIVDLQEEISEFKNDLFKEKGLKNLLFEQGKPLEASVTKALHILGYSAEGYDDGTLELDHVITSPEGNRYIGECEGKDNKDIDITKFRQLVESMNADFSREDVEEKAFGILFGNPQRLIEPSERTLDFTKKCKVGALREGIALVKTSDLFTVARYVLETNDAKFKKKCREAIHNSLGEVVVFPKTTSKKKQ